MFGCVALWSLGWTGFWLAVLGALLCLRLLTLFWSHHSLAQLATPTAKLPPGSLGLPLIGETLQFILSAATGKFYGDREEKYGPVFKTHILGQPTIYISGVQCMRTMYTMEQSHLRNAWPAPMQELMGRGCLSMASAQFHKDHKRTIFQAFRKLDSWEELSRILFEELGHWEQQKEIEVYESAKFMTIRAACTAVLGVGVSKDEVVQIARDLQDYGQGFFTVPLRLPGTTFSKALEARKRLKHILKQKLQYENNNCQVGEVSVLQAISLEVRKDGATPEEEALDFITDAALELLFGGQETVSCFVTCAMMLLKQYPEVFLQLREEVDRNLPDGPTLHIYERHFLDGLKYVDCVAKEVLRLFPPIGGGFRKAIADFEIEGYHIPKDWTVTYSIKSTHEQSPQFTEKSEFQPGRWLEPAPLASPSSRSPFHYLPFGAGMHCCVGRDYAHVLTRMFLVAVVSLLDWDLLTAHPQMLVVPLVKPKHGMLVKVRARHR